MFKRRDPMEPAGVVSTALETIFGIILGVLIAMAWLVFKPVTIASATPAPSKAADEGPPERHAVVYITGRSGGSGRSSQTTAKQRAFLQRTPGVLAVSEEDVNNWIGTTYRSLDLSRKWDTYSTEIHPSMPLFRFVDSEVEIGMTYDAACFGAKRTFVVQTRGVFEKQNGEEVFVPHKMYVGSCPLPAGPAGWVYHKIAAQFAVPDEAKAAWAAVQEAKVEKDKLDLTIAGATGG